jgi:hypothetical protein
VKLAELSLAASSLKIGLISERISKRGPHDISWVAKPVEYHRFIILKRNIQVGL